MRKSTVDIRKPQSHLGLSITKRHDLVGHHLLVSRRARLPYVYSVVVMRQGQV